MNPFKPEQRIRALIEMKQFFPFLRNEKNAAVIDYLDSFEIPIDYNEEQSYKTPDLTEIARQLKTLNSKVSPLIRDLYNKCILLLETRELNVKHSKTIIRISGHRDYERGHPEYDKCIFLEVNLPVLPRVGETIHLSFIDPGLKDYRGTVFSIDHFISGNCQTITVEVDRRDNYYYKWRLLQKETEEWDNWLHGLDVHVAYDKHKSEKSSMHFSPPRPKY